MPHIKPARIWTQAEKNHLQHLLQERHDEGRYWRDSRTSREFLTKKMNEEFPPRDQPDGRMFFVRHVEEYLREWVGNHPDPRQVQMPEGETDSEEEGGDEEDGDDDDGDGDNNGGRGAITKKAPEEQGEDGQDNQDAQDAGDQDEEGEDNDTDEERGKRREWRAGGKSSAAEARKANKKLPKREQ
ncbi:hypothetical protein EAF00_010184 [Botryotinia globosa]|nr:hypothetical protein EAF00_010184 [Botryotinia globosa]